MNKSRELGIIDFAVYMTAKSKKEFSNDEYLANAIEQYIKNNYSNGFTRNGDARGLIESLNKDQIQKELLLNIIKISALRNYNHEATLLGTNKSFDDKLSLDEVELLSTNLIKEHPKESIDNILSRYPQFYHNLIYSFVFRRYFDYLHKAENLDNPDIILGEYKYLYDKIEREYSPKISMTY